MPKSTRSKLPTLERKPGGPDNWVERVGGLPQYIDRIARHLHYDRGMTISHAIATAVNTVKRWARKGSVVKYNDPNNKHVTTITAAQAARDVAEWEAKKAAARGTSGRSRRSGRIRTRSARLSMEGGVNANALLQRASEIADPVERARVQLKIVDLAFPPGGPGMKKRKQMAKAGTAMPNKGSGGSFPIDDVAQLKKAIRAFGRAKDKAAARRHIIKRARALGAVSSLPSSWKVSLAQGAVDLAMGKMSSDDTAAAKALAAQAKSTIKTLGPMLAKVSDQRVMRSMIQQIQYANECMSQCKWWTEDSPGYSLTAKEQAYVDLAMTKDGRKSFKRQGKWKHGFIPVDAAAVQSKAKGSPIATKRVNRLYGSPSKAANASKAAVKRTVALRHAKDDITVRATGAGRRKGSSTETAQTASELRRADIKNAGAGHRANKGAPGLEVGRGRKGSSKATKAWESISDEQKTIRNGKKYVVVQFGGEKRLTEWVGPSGPTQTSDATIRARRTIQTQALTNLTTAQLRRMLKKADLSPEVRKKVNKALKTAIAKAKRSEKK